MNMSEGSAELYFLPQQEQKQNPVIVAANLTQLHDELDQSYAELESNKPDKLAPIKEQLAYGNKMESLSGKRELLLQLGKIIFPKNPESNE